MKILMTFGHFPVSIPRYFKEAFERLGHTVYTAGVPFHNWLPWTAEGADHEGMLLPERYSLEPTVPLVAGETYTWDAIVQSLPELPDFILHHPTPDGKFTPIIAGVPSRKSTYALLLTDPHVLEWFYKGVRYDADYVFNMQDCYKQEGDFYIPYAYAPQHHYYEPTVERDLDAVCIGLQYPPRKAVMDELKFDGYNVVSQVGLAFDEYRAIHNRASVAFSWSSKHDTIARVFEAPQMGCALVTNVTPDLFKFFNDDEITVFRGGVAEAVTACKRLIHNKELATKMSWLGYRATKSHTYESRATLMLNIISSLVDPVQHSRTMHMALEGVKESRRATP